MEVKPERVVAWEQGERQLMLRQAENLARFLHRPLSIFRRRRQFRPAAEYRRLPGVQTGAPPAFRLAIRRKLKPPGVRWSWRRNSARTCRRSISSRICVRHRASSARLHRHLGLALDTQLSGERMASLAPVARSRGRRRCPGVPVHRGRAREPGRLAAPLAVTRRGDQQQERVPETKIFTLLHNGPSDVGGDRGTARTVEQRSSAELDVRRRSPSRRGRCSRPKRRCRTPSSFASRASWSIDHAPASASIQDDPRRTADSSAQNRASCRGRPVERGATSCRRSSQLSPARGGGFGHPAEKAVSPQAGRIPSSCSKPWRPTALPPWMPPVTTDEIDHFDAVRALPKVR